MFLQTFPKQKIYVAMNLLPNYLAYTFREPGGVTITADGLCSMGRWAVKDSREVDIKYHPFGGKYLAEAKGKAATHLVIAGARGKPRVTLNGKDVSAQLRAGAGGWRVSLTGAQP
jgi:hypothetical protein